MIVGVLGGGQLARMLALAGHPLGLECVFLAPDEDACAAPLGDYLRAPYEDEAALERLAERADVVTYEFENVPLAAVEFLAEHVAVMPSPTALATAQDRLAEKTLFRRLAIPTPTFAAVDSLDDLAVAVKTTGYPALLKTRRMGYDGKGQAVLRTAADLAPAWERLNRQPCIVEAMIPFEREVSVVAVRGRDGQTAFYPLSENTHREGILWLSVSRPQDPLHGQACAYAQQLLDALDYTGVMALELFQAGDRLLANEIAPRVHNTGHWTIEGAECSQFENHLRAIAGWPLGSTAPVGLAAMVNFIGAVPDAAEALALSQVHLHAYGKAHRQGRKVGHATVRADDAQTLESATRALVALAETVYDR